MVAKAEEQGEAADLKELMEQNLAARHTRYRAWEEVEKLEAEWKGAWNASDAEKILQCEKRQPELRVRALGTCAAQKAAHMARWPKQEPLLLQPVEEAREGLAQAQRDRAALLAKHAEELRAATEAIPRAEREFNRAAQAYREVMDEDEGQLREISAMTRFLASWVLGRSTTEDKAK